MSAQQFRIPGVENAEPLTVNVQAGEPGQYTVTLGENIYSLSLEITAPGEGWLHLNGEVVPFYVIKKDAALHVWVRGRVYPIEPVEATASRGSASGSGAFDGEIKSPMPGTILKIQAQPGDVVEANQPLVIMESMKMEMTLSAPVAGTVKKIGCTEGQLVEMGMVLLELET